MSRFFTKLLKKRSLPIRSQGQSMLPVLHPNDITYLKKTSFNQIKVDDLVAFQKKGQIISHRVIYKTKKYLITKGDNALLSDGKIYPYQILGKIYQLKRNGKILYPETLPLIQSTVYFQEIVKIKNIFDAKQINYVFLKGLPLHLYFEKTQPKRIYADCDVLIDKKDFKRAENVLHNFGYQKINSSLSFFHKAIKRKDIENTYFKIINQVGVVFDLHLEVVFMMTQLSHLDLLYPQSLLDDLTADFLKNKKQVVVNQERFLILKNQFLIIYLALHLFHHNFCGAFRYQFLNQVIKNRKIDWKKTQQIINQYKLTNFVSPVFYLLKKYFKTPIPNWFLDIKQKKLIKFYHLDTFDIFTFDIFKDESRIKAGINRFFLLFILSPSPVWKKIFVFLNPQVILSILWVGGKKLIKKCKI